MHGTGMCGTIVQHVTMLHASFPIFRHYWQWYYRDRLSLLYQAWRNFIAFGIRFFSIPLLVRTFFAPFHRYSESYGRGFDIKQWLLAGFSNALFRVMFIAIGVVFEAAVLVIGGIILIGWVILPAVLFAALLFSLTLLL